MATPRASRAGLGVEVAGDEDSAAIEDGWVAQSIVDGCSQGLGVDAVAVFEPRCVEGLQRAAQS